jgi:hypothetical protein
LKRCEQITVLGNLDDLSYADRDSYLKLRTALNLELGLRPWLPDPLDTEGPPPDWLKEPDKIADWRDAARLRWALIEAAKAAA